MTDGEKRIWHSAFTAAFDRGIALPLAEDHGKRLGDWKATVVHATREAAKVALLAVNEARRLSHGQPALRTFLADSPPPPPEIP